MTKIIEKQIFDQERAFYNELGTTVSNCSFDGPADGESAFKECRNIKVKECYFNLRYPFWHNKNAEITDCVMTEKCRAALWYSENITICDTKLHGIKALRECKNVDISDCDIISSEFGWSTIGLKMTDTTAESEYFMLRGEKLNFKNVRFKGKYSFQYIKDSTFDNCVFNTKDAFWHAENITVKNSVINGEYLAWYSNSLTLINCKISGTQPLCYCKDLRLINCEMIDADLCFEKSDVKAQLTAPVISIKNPKSGAISVPSVGKIIMDDPKAKGRVIIA